MTCSTSHAPKETSTIRSDENDVLISSNSRNNHWNREIVREGVWNEIPKQVLRQKLSKLRHLVIPKAIHATYLDSLFPTMLKLFAPQTVQYNGGIAKITSWKISCYLEVMEGGIPCTDPNLPLFQLFEPLLNTCNDLFVQWYRQQHACNKPDGSSEQENDVRTCHRLMTFITRYTAAPGEQALLKVSTRIGTRMPRVYTRGTVFFSNDMTQHNYRFTN